MFDAGFHCDRIVKRDSSIDVTIMPKRTFELFTIAMIDADKVDSVALSDRSVPKHSNLKSNGAM
jgi:hypothetical protein